MPDHDKVQNLDKTTPAYKKLKVGDPWSFLGVTDEQLDVAEQLQAQDRPTSAWFNTGEPGRLFKVVCIHRAEHAIETVYIGFQDAPGSDNVRT